MKKRWHIVRKNNRLRLSRRKDAQRFDFSVSLELPLPQMPVDMRRFQVTLAHQVRQDIWRALQTVRGFSPVVEVLMLEGEPASVRILAGGTLRCHAPRLQLAERVSFVLESEARQQRWLRHALRRSGVELGGAA